MIAPGLRTTANGLDKLVIENSACQAELYLQGAHLTSWKPTGHEEVLFLSNRSTFAEGKAIRGGIPLIFPWFGPRTAKSIGPLPVVDERTDGPSHGFARTSMWSLVEADLDGGLPEGSLKLQLTPDEKSRALGFDNFQTTLEISLGTTLKLTMTTENSSENHIIIEEAFHTYLHVGDAESISLSGLTGGDYLDKTAGMARKTEQAQTVRLEGETDRPYLNTRASITLDDPILKRRIYISKENSLTTVVWNPWIETTTKLADMEPQGWRHMVCIEAANALENAVVIAPGEKHAISTTITVEKLSV